MLNKDTYCTPPWVLESIYEFYGRADLTDPDAGIDLDPASGEGSIVKAHKVFTKEDDGLAQNWFLYKRIFCNPPYSKPNLAHWSLKCAMAGYRAKLWDGPGPEILLLVPAYTSAKWYQNNVLATASAILFYNKRVSFLLPDGSKSGSPTFHSCLVYWGPRTDEFVSTFRYQGFVVIL